MKLLHTPLDALTSKKKVIAGVAALALIGGITPALTNNTYAADLADDTEEETVYTTIGPRYYTYVDDILGYYKNNNYDISIADTSVADFYTERCYTDYACLQGKKIGSTEIVLEKDGEDTLYIPVQSVELTPEAISLKKIGEKFSVTGSINGADDSLLTIYDVGGWGVEARQTGERSVYIDSSNTSGQGSAEINWMIGNQYVGGGTNYAFMAIEGIDNVFHISENEEVIERAVIDFVTSSFSDTPREMPSDSIFVTQEGNVFRFAMSDDNTYYGPMEKLQGSLDFYDASLSESTKDKLASELPKGVKGVKYKDIKVFVKEYFRQGGGGEAAALNSLVAMPVNNNGGNMTIGYFESLVEPLTMAIDVSNVKAVKDGYTRKWYVTRDNNGTIEKVDATYDEDSDTIRFATNIFGLYAYGYVDEKESAPAPLVPNTGIAPKQIATTAVATILPLLGIAGVAFMIRSKKRTDNKLAKKHNHFE